MFFTLQTLHKQQECSQKKNKEFYRIHRVFADILITEYSIYRKKNSRNSYRFLEPNNKIIPFV